MDKRYITLFKELAQATAVSAEQVMDYDHEKGDEKGWETAKQMRDDFQDLADKITDDFQPNKSDIARLAVGAMIMSNQLQDKINALKKALTGYQTDVVPKLQHILEEAKDDDEVIQMANETFVIEDNE